MLHAAFCESVLDWAQNFGSLIWHIRLERTQNLLYESTKDFLRLKFDSRSQEKSWMSEKDRLLRELESQQKGKRKAGSANTPLGRSQRLSRSTSMLPPEPQPEPQHGLKVQRKKKSPLEISKVVYFLWQRSSLARYSYLIFIISSKLLLPFFWSHVFIAKRDVCFHQVLQDKLKQSQRLAEMYREQCISLESELAKVKEEGDATREIFQVPLVFKNHLTNFSLAVMHYFVNSVLF